MAKRIADGLRVCSECGIEKPPDKYYRQHDGDGEPMARCKACHNGCTKTNERLSAERMQPQLGDPTEEEIAAECLMFQAKWSDSVRDRRRSLASNFADKQRRRVAACDR